MRAQCCICADLFENSTSVNIAAAPCGHTFHETCLMRWMDTSSTCPSCRTTVKKNLIIKRLFFDAVDDLNGDDNDTDRLLNQVGNLKAQLIEKEKKEAELKESRDSYMCRLASSESLCAELTIKLNHKHDHIDMLQKSLGTLQKENAAYMEEMMAYHKTKKKLLELESLNSLLKGEETDIKDMIRQYSDGGESSVKTLVSMLTVLRQEYNKVLGDKKTLLTKMSDLKKKIGHYNAMARSCKEKEGMLQAELEKAYESLTKVEKENNENRRKLVHLRNALRHNKTEGSQSFHQALHEDSPNVAFTPPLHVNSGNQENITSTPLARLQSPELFDDSPLPSSTKGEGCETPKLKFISVSTAKERFQVAKKAKVEIEDAPQIPATFYSIMQKKVTGVSNSRAHVPSVITRGYDGFGGSTKFVHPSGPPKLNLLNNKKLNQKLVKRLPFEGSKSIKNQMLLKDCVLNNQGTSSSTCSSNNFVQLLSARDETEQVKPKLNKIGSLFKKSSSSENILSSFPRISADSEIIDLT